MMHGQKSIKLIIKVSGVRLTADC